MIVIAVLLVLILLVPIVGYIRLASTFNHHVSSNVGMEQRFIFRRDKVYFKTNDNLKIAGWYTKAENPKAVVILVHGFTESDGGKSLMLEHAQYLKEVGYSSLAIDLRGTGESDGNKVFFGTKEWKDVEAAYDYLKGQPENINKKIGCFGISMGASTCISFMGLTHKGDFLIASVPFSSPLSAFNYTLEKEKFPSKVFKPFVTYVTTLIFGLNYNKFTAITNVKEINAPKLFISAKNDKDINPMDAVNLYNGASQPKQLWETETQHDVFNEKPEEFRQQILNFLKQQL